VDVVPGKLKTVFPRLTKADTTDWNVDQLVAESRLWSLCLAATMTDEVFDFVNGFLV